MAARAIAHSGAEASADKAATPFMAFSRRAATGIGPSLMQDQDRRVAEK